MTNIISVTRKHSDKHGHQVVNKHNGFLLGYYSKAGALHVIKGMLEMEGIKTVGFKKRDVVNAFNDMYINHQTQIRRSLEKR